MASKELEKSNELVKQDSYRVKAQEVEPVKNIKDINKVKQWLMGKEDKRDYLLFVLGINVGLRASDLLSLKIGDVVHKVNGRYKALDIVYVAEKKTDKQRALTLNKSVKEAIEVYLKSLEPFSENDYLFKSKKGDNKPLRVDSTHKLIKKTMRVLNIKGNYGTHTLRKTFGYHAYMSNVKDNPRILHELQKIFNHSSENITLKYIGITKDDITNIYMNLNL